MTKWTSSLRLLQHYRHLLLIQQLLWVAQVISSKNLILRENGVVQLKTKNCWRCSVVFPPNLGQMTDSLTVAIGRRKKLLWKM